MLLQSHKIYIAGHHGMVGSALVRYFKTNGFHHLILKSSLELDLRNQQAINHFLKQKNPNMFLLLLPK